MCAVGNAIINSTIQYCAPIWGPGSAGSRTKVQASQIRAARIITGRWNREHQESHRQDLLTSMNWPNVEQMVNIASLNLLKKTITGKGTKGIRELFAIKRPDQNARRKEIRVDFKGPKKRLPTIFSAYVTNKFNALPNELKDPKIPIRKFKKLSKEHVLSKYQLKTH